MTQPAPTRLTTDLLAGPGMEVTGDRLDRTLVGLYSLALRITGDARAAEDVVEHTLIEAGRAAGTAAFEIPLGTLMRRCRTLALVRAGKRPIAALRRRPAWTAAAPDTEDGANGTDAARAAATAAMGTLAAEERLVLEMMYFEGYALADVAASLHCAPRVARARLRRALGPFAGPGRPRHWDALWAPPTRPARGLRRRLVMSLARALARGS